MTTERFAIVELLGRQCFGAKVQEADFCGIKVLLCEVLTDPPYVREVHPQAIYAVTPCAEERAKLACRFLVSATLMPTERAHTALPAPSSLFEDSATDDIPFRDPDDSSADEDDSSADEDHDEVVDDDRDFECTQCGAEQTIDFNSEHMDVPDGWAAVPPGWSLIPRDPTEDMFFCSESCVRAFVVKAVTPEKPWTDEPEDERLHKPRAIPSARVEVSGPLSMHHVEALGDWYCLEPKHGLCLTDSAVEGTLSEMLLLARAIQARESYSTMRCAVAVVGDRVYFWSPHGSDQKAIVPLAVADALASEIRSFAAGKSQDGES
jgi:hypothetical protein